MRSVLLAAFRGVGLVLALTLLAAWLFQPVPLILKILPASLLFLSAARPAAGLVVLAGIGPMANAISVWSQSPLPGIRLLEQLILAHVFGAGLRWWGRRGTELRLSEAAALLAASATASFVAVQPALLLSRMPDFTVWEHLRALIWKGEYFLRSSLWDPLFFTALTLEGLALAVTAERIVRRDGGAAESTIRMAVVGHAGVAALNLQQVIGAAIRSGDAWRALPGFVRDVRVSLFYDVNAAGSVFALIGLAGMSLIRGLSRDRWVVALFLTVIGLGLWMAGSRAALLALVLTLAGLLGLLAWTRSGRARWLAGTAIAAIFVAATVGVLIYPSARNAALGPAAATRRIMAETSVNMWRATPVLGVGVGRFFEESSRFGAAALKDIGLPFVNENAHNYFLQILGTEGLVGFGALLLILAVALIPAIRADRSPLTTLRGWLFAAVVAYLLTCLTGHPLLVPEASFAFWLIFGVLAGLTPPPAPAAWRGPVALAAALLIMTGPFRAAEAIRAAHLEHVAVGLSSWQAELDGVRYRIASKSFALYLPEDGSTVTLPVRLAPAAPDYLTLTASVDGRRLYEVVVSGDAWQNIRLQLPKGRRRFARTDFEIKSIGPGMVETPAIYVGKAVQR